jgi:opacity protein-like surface antigen
MQYWALALVILAGVTSTTRTSSAQSAWYIVGSAGAHMRADDSGAATFSNPQVSSPGTNTTSFDPGVLVNLAVGYRLPLGFPIEGELDFAYCNTNTASPFTPASTRVGDLDGTTLDLRSGGNHERYTQTVNAFYDLLLSGQFIPYVGMGFGATEDNGSNACFTEDGGSRTYIQHSATGIHPAVLAEVGLTIRLNNKWSVVPTYRFPHVFQSGNATEENANIVKVGLRYSF